MLSKNLDGAIYPASTVKLLSGLIFTERLADRIEEKVTVTQEMVKDATGRRFGLEVGQSVTVEHLLYIAVCGSFNDAYTALAVLVCGSVDSFVELMNARAAELGATSSHFTNVTGLHDPKMHTTARDLLAIACAAAQSKLFLNLSSTYTKAVQTGGTTKTDPIISYYTSITPRTCRPQTKQKASPFYNQTPTLPQHPSQVQ